MLAGSKLLWLSDTHLNVIPRWLRRWLFTNHVRKHAFDGIIITGDITTGKHLARDLQWLSETFSEVPIWFVLGNHDYYGYGFSRAHSVTRASVAMSKNLSWLTEESVVSLSKSTALVGCEGWYSGSFGDASLLSWSLDWLRIPELKFLRSQARFNSFYRLATESASQVVKKVRQALETHDHVIVATHFPPEPQTVPFSLRFQNFWLSYSTNVPMGFELEQLALEYPTKTITVLSGHTHENTVHDKAANLRYLVSDATCWSRIAESNVLTIKE